MAFLWVGVQDVVATTSGNQDGWHEILTGSVVVERGGQESQLQRV